MAVGDLIIPSGFGQAVFKWQLNGRVNPLSMTMGYAPDGDSSDAPAHAEEIFHAMTVTDAPSSTGLMSSQWTILGVDVIYNDDGVMLGGASSHAPIVGSDTDANPLIIGNSWVVQKRTGLVGRQYRGRFYMPYMAGDESTVNHFGTIGPANVTQMQSCYAVFLTQLGMGTIGIIPNLLHHVPKTGTAPVPTPITSFNVESQVGTQRRRLR